MRSPEALAELRAVVAVRLDQAGHHRESRGVHHTPAVLRIAVRYHPGDAIATDDDVGVRTRLGTDAIDDTSRMHDKRL